MSDRLVKHGVFSPTLLMAVVALLWPGVGRSALPSADGASQNRDSGPIEQPGPLQSGGTADGETTQGNVWALPPVRIGGAVSYDLRRDTVGDQTRTQHGFSTTLNASTQTFIWQPWFSQLTGNVGLTFAKSSSDSNATEFGNSNSNKSRNVILTGGGQLSILPQSRFPFEAHFNRNDSRISSQLAIGNGYASQRYGFSQHYTQSQGDSMFGWDRSTQDSDLNGRDQQDSWQLSISHALQNQRMQLIGNRSVNTHEDTDESAVQNNLTLQHSYTPSSSLSVESMSNISRSNYHLVSGDNNTRITQLSTLAFWRPDDQPLTVTGGARLFTLASDSTGFRDTSFGFDGNSAGARNSNANVNLGINYELSRFTRLNAGANVNLITTNGLRSNNTNQTIGATYQPDFTELGKFRYNWSAGSSFTNTTGSEEASRQVSLQLSHGLSRSFTVSPISTVSMDLSQSVAAVASSGNSNRTTLSDGTFSEDSGSTLRLTHSGSLSWNISKEPGDAMIRLSASDSRTVSGRKEFFQLINLQASSNLPTGEYSSWTGNLTIQGVRQEFAILGNTTELGILQQNSSEQHGFVTTSGGSLTYQHQRVFGVRRLRFVSDLRLNSQALLPLLGGPQDQETAAWENRFDYSIGRTQLRLNMLIARNSVPRATTAAVQRATTLNRSILFSVTRTF
ncbi:hypothetical protein [Polaromonas sp.]|uniref:hypothetical protein n=1 Tax=Polaromonas sp. TaxID=1869339 RepID=UPI001791DE14|nr:hypothetical protein [Polaromonas sp.]NMM05023.1 hypothetical protein [Polaromonas sp.]